MAEIYPNGTIQIYSGIKLDNTYQHCLSFASAAARESFFAGTPLLKHTVSAVSYQRITSGVCELQIAIGQLYDCNYMRFQNAGFSNKWFYAFITNVEYVNNITSRIFYEIDVNTTYYFDWNYLPCLVEREHVTNDTVGAHTIPEPIGVKNAYPTLLNTVDIGSSGYAVVCAKVEMLSSTEFAASEFVGNLSAPIRYYIFNSGDQDKTIGTYTYRAFTVLTGLLHGNTDWANAASELVSFFYFPFNLLTTPEEGLYQKVSRIVTHTTYNFNKPTSLHGYTPRNKKLLTFPYNYITVDNGDVVNQYRQEWWRTQSLSFDYTGALCCNPEVYLMPRGYTNSSGSDPCWSEKSVLSNFPQVPYPIDSYMAWLAQTQSTRKAKTISSTLSTAATGAGMGAAAGGPMGAVAGGLAGAAAGLLSAAGENAISAAEVRDQANKYSGQSTGSTEIAVGEQKFRINQMCVTAEEAASIDSFFDMYGYQVNVVKTPQIRTRAHWNYLKTNGCNMSAQAIPAEYVAKIKQIHDNGVTFWKSHDEIGNYGLDNRI